MNRYVWLVIAGLILWFSETAYFGWNAKPQSAAEQALDVLSGLLIVWGIIGDLLRNTKIRVVKYDNHYIKAKKFTYVDQRQLSKKTNLVQEDKHAK